MPDPVFDNLTLRDRKRLVQRAETALYELVLAEPTGAKSARVAMLGECVGLLNKMRRRLHLVSGAA